MNNAAGDYVLTVFNHRSDDQQTRANKSFARTLMRVMFVLFE